MIFGYPVRFVFAYIFFGQIKLNELDLHVNQDFDDPYQMLLLDNNKEREWSNLSQLNRDERISLIEIYCELFHTKHKGILTGRTV
ncbi:Tail fiber protein [Dirofilaria immitis]